MRHLLAKYRINYLNRIMTSGPIRNSIWARNICEGAKKESPFNWQYAIHEEIIVTVLVGRLCMAVAFAKSLVMITRTIMISVTMLIRWGNMTRC
jgi:hypothetical protein